MTGTEVQCDRHGHTADCGACQDLGAVSSLPASKSREHRNIAIEQEDIRFR
jgi:hypothetical protein